MILEKKEIESLFLWGVIGVLYLLRNKNPFFKSVWKFIRIFFLVLLATLTVNYAKKSIKEWWNKD
jgi:hypothetical protein